MKLDLAELEKVVAIGTQGAQGVQKAPATTAFPDDKPISPGSGKKQFRITVEGVQGVCVARHKAGEVFMLSDDKTPKGICLTAFAGLLPYINAMIYDAKFDFEPREGRIRLGCPDPDNNVVFLIEEIPR